jgi:hypothetical protein
MSNLPKQMNLAWGSYTPEPLDSKEDSMNINQRIRMQQNEEERRNFYEADISPVVITIRESI